MEESAALARRIGLQLHTHLAETVEEDAYCRELYGCSPVEYLERVGWIDGDVWCAHCVHLSGDDVAAFASAGVGVAHCPTSNLRLGAGVAPVRSLLDAGVRVGLGVDGTASNERGDLFGEVKQALLVARGRDGGAALTARDALRLGTRGGAEVLRRPDIGSLEPGKRADLAIWRTDGLEFGGAEDLVANLVLSGPHRVDRLLVGGRDVVRGGALVNADEQEIAARAPETGAEDVGRLTISTHVLDTEQGRPAAGVKVELFAADGSLAGAGCHRRGRADPGARRRGRGDVPPGVPSAVAVLQARRARARARRRPPPRPSADLVVRVRELPRQLSVDELSDLFEGRTTLTERLATVEDPLARAREIARALTPDEQVEVLAAHPQIGAQTELSKRSAAEQGTDDDPSRARRARRPQRCLRAAVRIPLRGLREPAAAT